MASPLSARKFHLLAGATFSFLIGASSVHCGGAGSSTLSSGTGSGFGGSTTAGSASGGAGGTMSSMSGLSGAGGDITIDVQTKDYSAEDFFENDPPPLSCDGGGMAHPPGGTPECPDDKNLPGCGCPSAGAKAACWTGLRKNRLHGVCKDGQTTCNLTGENDLAWGPCVGEQLPTGTTGKAACGCFSGGKWAIDNLSPCFFSSSQNGPVIATTSTSIQGGTIQCPADDTAAPAEDWSTDSITTDCTGTFKLCYSLKAGKAMTPLPTDCEIIKVCSEAYYSVANAVQALPPLPGWLADPGSVACAQQFVDSGGYGEMSVVGQSDECEGVDKVFNRVNYCPLSCNTNPNGPGCAGCMAGGSGNF
jgi:hypothetical protein